MSALILSVTFLYSCSDKEPLAVATAPTEDSFGFSASTSTAVLNKTDAKTHNAITFQWDSLAYGINTPITFTLQMDSLKGDFSKPIQEEIVTNKFNVSYTDSVLNLKALQLKLAPAAEGQIKVRLKANLAFNQLVSYSKVLTIKLTPYEIIKPVSYLYLSGLGNEKLCSPDNDGKYEGYVKAAQWANFKFSTGPDGTGTVYGSLANSLYSLDTSAAQWNVWFDEGGYFLLKANTNNMTWSKTAVTSFCVTGEFNSWSLTANPMTYDATNKVWTAVCNISTVLYGIQIIGNQNWDFKYGDTNATGALTLSGANIVVNTPGTYTVTMDLSNPGKYTYSIK